MGTLRLAACTTGSLEEEVSTSIPGRKYEKKDHIVQHFLLGLLSED